MLCFFSSFFFVVVAKIMYQTEPRRWFVNFSNDYYKPISCVKMPPSNDEQALYAQMSIMCHNHSFDMLCIRSNIYERHKIIARNKVDIEHFLFLINVIMNDFSVLKCTHSVLLISLYFYFNVFFFLFSCAIYFISTMYKSIG